MLSITLTPMQVAPAPSAGSSAIAAPLDSDPSGCRLRLSPGEPSELVVQVRNDRDQALGVTLRVEGNFPPGWYQVGQEGNFLPPGRQMDAVVRFSLPADHFEQLTLGPGERLHLDYQGQVVLEGRVLPEAPPPDFPDPAGAEAPQSPPDSPQAQTPQETSAIVPLPPPSVSPLVWQSTAAFTLVVRPHSLYPQFLPTLYQEVDFIGRLLAIFEQTFEPDVHTLESLWAYLDPLTAPTDLLPFLAHWVGWQAIPLWPLNQQRRLIRRALEIYRYRGTRQGLRLFLHLYTQLPLAAEAGAIAIEEIFTRGFVMGDTHLGRNAILGGGKPFHFRVRLRPPLGHSLDEGLIRTIIEQEKPAFCTYDLVIEDLVIEDLVTEPTG